MCSQSIVGLLRSCNRVLNPHCGYMLDYDEPHWCRDSNTLHITTTLKGAEAGIKIEDTDFNGKQLLLKYFKQATVNSHNYS